MFNVHGHSGTKFVTQKCLFRLWIILNNQNPKLRKQCSPSSICLKNASKGPGPRRELSPQIFVSTNWVCGQGGIQQSLLFKYSYLCPVVMPSPANICLPTLTFPSPGKLTFSL